MRRLTNLAAVALAATILTGLASAAQKPGATYKGTSAVGPGDVWLVVSPDGTAVTRFLVTGVYGSGCTIYSDLTSSVPITAEHTFSINAYGIDVVNGSFPTDTTAEGSMQLGGGSSCQVSTTWTVSLTDEQAPPPWGGGPPPVRCRVPSVVGLGLARARTQIRRHWCTVGRVRYARSKRPRGRVISQTPRPGLVATRGTPVRLTVSRGRKPA
jgi:hypothetical protein